MKIVPKNWSDYQHYKNRRPPWIKVYRSLLENMDFHSLSDGSKSLMLMLWLIASESKTGEIDADSNVLAFRLHTASTIIDENLKPLIDKGFFVASNMLASRYQDAIPEKRREEYIREEENHVDKSTIKKPDPQRIENLLKASSILKRNQL